MAAVEKDVFVVVEDRGDRGAVLVLVLAGDKMPASFEDLPQLGATFDAEKGYYVPGKPARRSRAAAGPAETKADAR